MGLTFFYPLCLCQVAQLGTKSDFFKPACVFWFITVWKNKRVALFEGKKPESFIPKLKTETINLLINAEMEGLSPAVDVMISGPEFQTLYHFILFYFFNVWICKDQMFSCLIFFLSLPKTPFPDLKLSVSPVRPRQVLGVWGQGRPTGERKGQKDPEASDHLLQSAAAGSTPALPADPVSGLTGARGPGGQAGPHPDSGGTFWDSPLHTFTTSVFRLPVLSVVPYSCAFFYFYFLDSI